MSQPLKRGFLPPDPNDAQYYFVTPTESPCKINAPHSKRQRQYGTNTCSGLSSGQQDSFLSETSGFYDQDLISTEPNQVLTWHDNDRWNAQLQTDIPNLSLSYVDPGYSVIDDTQTSANLAPDFIYPQPKTDQSALLPRLDFGHFSGFFTPAQGVPNGLPSEGIELVNSVNNCQTLCSYDLNCTGNSLPSCVWNNPANSFDWMGPLLEEAAKSPYNGDSTSSTDTSSYEAFANVDAEFEAGTLFQPHLQAPHTQPRRSTTAPMPKDDKNSRFQVQIQRRPDRKLVPLCHDKDHTSGESTFLHTKFSGMQQGSLLNRPNRRLKLGRTQPLRPEVAKQAAWMRKDHACLRCHVMKIKCSPGETCESCKSRTLCHGPCIRFDLELYTEYFFPAIVNSSYKEWVVEQFFNDNVVAGFKGSEIVVQISSGPTYQPMELSIHEFQYTNEEFLAISQIKTGDDGNLSSEFTQQYAPPFILARDTKQELRAKCVAHVKSIAAGARCRGEVHYKDTSALSWDVFNAIAEYQKFSNSKVVGDALVLYAMHFFMTQNLLFTEDSADTVIKSLNRPPKLPYARTLTSNLITLQIKQAMHELVHEKTGHLLKNLQSKMTVGPKANRKLAWACSFSAISILCMCAEMVQSATDLKTVHMMIEEGCPNLLRSESMEQCRELPIKLFTEMFHMAFRSFSCSGTQKNENGFNPIRDGLNDANNHGVDEPTTGLIKELLRILAKHEDRIGKRMTEPSLDHNADDLSDLLGRHLTFREGNSGKLVANFLDSFNKY